MTFAHRVFWDLLRHTALGARFRREALVAGQTMGFSCQQHRLVIEIDGSRRRQEARRARDPQREANLDRAGWRVLRFTTAQVVYHRQDVLDAVCVAVGCPRTRLPASHRRTRRRPPRTNRANGLTSKLEVRQRKPRLVKATGRRRHDQPNRSKGDTT